MRFAFRSPSLVATLALLPVCAAFAVGCASDAIAEPSAGDAGSNAAAPLGDAAPNTDAASPIDAAAEFDASAPVDAGSPVDASAANDAGSTLDASTTSDAASGSDASVGIDAGATVDAGTSFDAGSAVDAGRDSGPSVIDAGVAPCGPTAGLVYDPSRTPNGGSFSVASVITFGDEVIFGLRPTGGVVGGGRVIACPKSGCGAQNQFVRVITTGVDKPNSLAVGGLASSSLFIGDISGNGTGAATDVLYACSMNGCGATPTSLRTGITGMTEMIQLGGRLYWHSTLAGSQLVRALDPSAANPTVVQSFANSGANIGLTGGGSFVFSSNQYTPATVRRFDTGTGAVSTILDGTASGGAHRYGITWAAGKLYWAASLVNPAPGRGVYRMNEDGSNVEKIAPLDFIPGGLVVDAIAGKVYVSTYNGFPSRIVAVDTTTGQVSDRASFSPTADLAPYHRHLAQDSRCLYWGTIGGTVYSVAK
jgi:hypothetical protein